jgi:hypothetical protein
MVTLAPMPARADGAAAFDDLSAERLAAMVDAELRAQTSPFDDVVVPNREAMVAVWLLLFFADELPETPEVLRPALRRVASSIEGRRRGTRASNANDPK